MKKLILLCSLFLLVLGAVAQNDTTRYTMVNGYGFTYNRLKAKAALVMPTDTVINKLSGSVVVLNDTLYVRTNVRWQAVSGTGAGLPAGGLTGQILAKDSDTNYDVSWIDNYTEDVRETVKASTSILKGQAVYVSGADGTNVIVSKASNTTEQTSSKTIGLLYQDLANNGIGFVVISGQLSGLNTVGATAGDPVWLGTNGNLLYGIANKPKAPAHMVYLGVVTRVNANNGEIFVHVQNGFEINELHDVLITDSINNQLLAYDSTTRLWKNKTIAQVLGYTPVKTTDTASMLTNYIRNGGYGLMKSGQTLSADTAIISTRAWRQKGIDSVASVRVGGTGTTNRVAKFTASGTVGNGSIADSSTSVQMTILSSGFVGVNVATPLERFHVNGAGRVNSSMKIFNPAYGTDYATSLRTDASANGILQLGNNGINYILAGNSAAGGQLSFRTNVSAESIASGSEALRIFSNGRLFVGSSPADAGYLLDVAGNLRTTTGAALATSSGGVAIGATSMDYGGQLYISGPNNQSNRFIFQSVIAGASHRTVFEQNGSTGSFIMNLDAGSNIPSGDFVIQGTAIELLRLKENGNLGIGAITATEKLDVNGRARIRTIDSTSTAMNMLYSDATGVIKKAPLPTGSISGTGIFGYIPKWTGSSSLDTSQIFQLGQNVGIGTASPTYRLHLPDIGGTTGVADQAMISGVVFGSNGNGQTIEPSGSRAFTILGQGRNGLLYTAVSGGVGRWGINTETINSASVLNLNGNMTIGASYLGTAAPSNGLMVEGNTLIGTATNNGYKLNVGGDATINTVRIGLGSGSIASNIVVGQSDALNSNTTGSENTVLGRSALTANTTGSLNVAVGFNSLLANSTGIQNTAVGHSAMLSNTGSFNTALGLNALRGNTTGASNSAFSRGAMEGNTTGSENVGVGHTSLYNNTTGSNNVAIGTDAGRRIGSTAANTITNNSIYIGYNTKAAADNQTNQVVIGYDAAGNGSNTTTIGNSSTAMTYIQGKLDVSSFDSTSTAMNLLYADANGVIKKSTAPGGGSVVGGTGTTNYVPKFTGTSTIGNSQIVDNAASGVNVGAKLTIRDDGPFLTGANIHSISSNFGIGTTSSSSLQLFTNSTNRLHINSAGDVGIGTTSPATKFNVEGGNIRASATTNNVDISPNGVITITSASGATIDNKTGTMFMQSPSQIIFRESGGSFTEWGRIKATGLGIGVDPSYKLDVAGTLRNTTGAAFATSSGNVLVGTTTDAGFKFDVAGQMNVRNNYSYFGGDGNTATYLGSFSNEGRIGVGGRSSFPTAALTFYTAEGTNNFERMRISSAGDVGINTNNPLYKLDVSGSLRNTTGANFATSSGIVGVGHTRTTGAKFQVDTDVSGKYNPNAITSTAAATEIYNASSSDTIASTLILVSKGTGSVGISTISGIVQGNGNGVLTFGTRNNSNSSSVFERMRINQDGNVGIGNTLPSEKLHVTGRIRATTIDSTATAINMLYADANGVIKKAAVPSGGITGTGISGYFPKWTGTSSQDTSQLFQLGRNIGIGTATPAYRLHLPDAGATANQAMIAGIIFGSDGNGVTMSPNSSNITIKGGQGNGSIYSGTISSVGRWGINTTSVSDAVFSVNGDVKIVTIDSTSTARNMLYQDANGVIKKSAALTMADDVMTASGSWVATKDAGSGTTINNVAYTTNGTTKMVTIDGNFYTDDFSQETWVDIATIATAYRPKKSVYFPASLRYEGADFERADNTDFTGSVVLVYGQLRVTDDGKIQVYASVSSNNIFAGGTAYFLIPFQVSFIIK